MLEGNGEITFLFLDCSLVGQKFKDVMNQLYNKSSKTLKMQFNISRKLLQVNADNASKYMQLTSAVLFFPKLDA